jgi:hypothetical protein
MYDAWQSIPEGSRKDYLPYEVFRIKICRSFQLGKLEALDRLRVLVDFGIVVMEKRGIKLNYQIKNEKTR